MHIVVVDDLLEMANSVVRALEETEHSVSIALAPEVLARSLDSGTRYDLALVDLDFGRESTQTGLAALRMLAELGIPSVVYSADSEDNRVLFLLAAFRYYAPLALLPKSATGEEVRRLVGHLAQGRAGLPTGPADPADRYRPHGSPPLLDRLIRSTTDLRIWEALSVFAARDEIVRTAAVGRSTVDKFLAQHIEAVIEVHALIAGGRPAPVRPGAEAQAPQRAATGHSHLLAPMHAFAVAHGRFFRDAEVHRLVRDQPSRPRKLTEASRGVRRRR